MNAHGEIMARDPEPPAELTAAQLAVLHTLTHGVASRANRTECDLPAGVLCVNSRVANELVRDGLARDVTHWRGVEITDRGRAALGRYGHLR